MHSMKIQFKMNWKTGQESIVTKEFTSKEDLDKLFSQYEGLHSEQSSYCEIYSHNEEIVEPEVLVMKLRFAYVGGLPRGWIVVNE